MTRIEGSIVINRPPEDVFDFVADEHNEPRYNPGMVHVEKLTPEPVGVGTRWRTTLETRGHPIRMDVEVTEHARPTRLGTRSTLSTAEITGGLTFTPHPSGTRMSWSWQLRPMGVLRLLTPLIGVLGRREERRTWNGLKRCLEQDAAAQPARD